MSAPHENQYLALKQNVEASFQEYLTNSEKSLPDTGLLWQQYKNKVDADYFLQLLVDGCRDLLSRNHSNADVLANDLENWSQTINSIQDLEQLSSFIRFHSWLEFHVVRLRGFKNGLKDYAVAVRWLRYCYNINDAHTTHFLLRCKLSRDEEMRLIVFDEDHVREFFGDPASSGHIYLDKLSSWFLARYDLDAAFLLLEDHENQKHGRRLSQLGRSGLRRLVVNSRACCFSIAITIFLVLGTQGYLYRETWKRFADSLLGFELWAPIISSSKVQTWILLPYQFVSLILIVLLIWFIWKSQRGEFRQLRKFLPRLLGGILVGYIPLISSEDIWKWLLTIKPAQALMVWALGALVPYLYLLVESRKAVNDGALLNNVKRDLKIRCAQVYSIGWAEASLIGILICELLGSTVIADLFPAADALLDRPLYTMVGLIGLLVPKVVLLYAPLALSFGILVQLIWEEKTATQPL